MQWPMILYIEAIKIPNTSKYYAYCYFKVNCESKKHLLRSKKCLNFEEVLARSLVHFGSYIFKFVHSQYLACPKQIKYSDIEFTKLRMIFLTSFIKMRWVLQTNYCYTKQYLWSFSSFDIQFDIQRQIPKLKKKLGCREQNFDRFHNIVRIKLLIITLT